MFFLVFNGVVIGAVAGYLTERGLGETFYSFVVTHGAFELTAIFLVGRRRTAPRPCAGRARAQHARAEPDAGRARNHDHRLRLRRDAADRRRDRSLLVVGALAAAAAQVFGGRRVLARRDRAISFSRAAVRIDSLALQMRPRAPHEAADLGVRLCQAHAGEVYRCYLAVAIPMALLALSLFEVAPWLPIAGDVVVQSRGWIAPCCSCWRAPRSGRRRRIGDLWREQRTAWWSRFVITWTWRRLSPWRSFTLPVYQLEGHSLFQMRRRVRQLRRRHSGAALMVTLAFSWAEIGLMAAWLSLVFWFAPPGLGFDFASLLAGEAAVAGAMAGVACLPARGAVPRAFLRGRGFRHVSQPPRRARSLGHRTGIPSCVCVLTCRESHSSCCSRSPLRRCTPARPLDSPRRSSARWKRSRPTRISPPKTTVRRLAWDRAAGRKNRDTSSRSPGWLEWIFDFFGWILQTSQMLFWLLIAAFVAVLIVLLVRLFATRGSEARAARFLAPTHVQDLDIRPESLPDDIGAAARAAVGSRRTPRGAGAAVSRTAVAAGACATKFRSAIRAPRATA